MKSILFRGAICALCAQAALAGQVWQSTFDTTADGVVDVYDDNPTKVMIGTPSGGVLPVTAQDPLSFATTDRVGRPLGTTLNGHNEYSALITFNYGALPTTSTPVYTTLGFSTSGGSNPGTARQISGALMVNTFNGTDYILRPGLIWASSSGQDRDQNPVSVNLGPNPFGKTFQLAISYLGDFNGLNNSVDTGTGMMRVDMYDNAGNPLSSVVQKNITAGDGGTQLPLLTGLGGEPGIYPTFLSNQTLTNLGVQDYRAFGTAGNVVYNLDSMAWYDGFGDALGDVTTPEPASLMLLATGGLLLRRRRTRA